MRPQGRSVTILLFAMAASGCAHHAPAPIEPAVSVRFRPPHLVSVGVQSEGRLSETYRRRSAGASSDGRELTFRPFSMLRQPVERSTLIIRNQADWDVAIQLQTAIDYSGRILGIVRAGESSTFAGLPSEQWVAFYATTGDGKQQLRRPGVAIGIGEAQEWILQPTSPWTTVRRE